MTDGDLERWMRAVGFGPHDPEPSSYTSLCRAFREFAKLARRDERDECAAIAREHAADSERASRKPYEGYSEGWQDASNEITWAIDARTKAEQR